MIFLTNDFGMQAIDAIVETDRKLQEMLSENALLKNEGLPPRYSNAAIRRVVEKHRKTNSPLISGLRRMTEQQ